MILSSMPLTIWGCPSDVLWKRIRYTPLFLKFKPKINKTQQLTNNELQQMKTPNTHKWVFFPLKSPPKIM